MFQRIEEMTLPMLPRLNKLPLTLPSIEIFDSLTLISFYILHFAHFKQMQPIGLG